MNEVADRERDELVALVRRIIDADFDSESLLVAALDEFQRRVPHPAVIDLIYHPARVDGEWPEPDPSKIVDEAMNYKAIDL